LRSIAFVIGPFPFSGIFARFINPTFGPYSAHFAYLAAALLFTAMLPVTRAWQPQFEQPSEKPVETIPSEEIGSASVAPIIERPEENS
jgi:hypothetical protein